MSYSPNRNEDSLSELFSSMADANTFCKRMLSYKDDSMGFVAWFEKARLADPRFTYLFLERHMDELTEETRRIVESFMARFRGMDKRTRI